MEILGAGLAADENHRVSLAGEFFGPVGVEDHRAGGRARRRRQSGGQEIDLALWIDGRVQQLVEVVGRNPRHGLFAADRPLVHHFAGDAHRSVA